MSKRLDKLLTIKSIVTLLFTLFFGYELITNKCDGAQFINLFQMVIAFYFGSQSNKTE